MKPSQMLQQMCQEVLADTDAKALCKARGFPQEAAASRGILETLFLSSQGLSNVLDALNSKEIALLHLLKNAETPVDVVFFARIHGGMHSSGTFTQRFKFFFDKTKQRLVRSGLLLLAEAPQSVWQKTSKMERWRFALPAEFHDRLPPLFQSPRQFEGSGNWRSDVVRDKLSADLGSRSNAGTEGVFQIKAGELRVMDEPFSAARLAAWQQAGWRQAISGEKKSSPMDPHSQPPDQAALCILSELADGLWADADQLAEPLQVFCGEKIDADAVCQAGWEWGLLAKRQAGGKNAYRLAPQQDPVAPDQYLRAAEQDGCVAADLTTIPFDVLEQIVAISDQCEGSKRRTLLIRPNFVKLGRADDKLLESEAVQWLLEQTQPFAEVYLRLRERRGKTILHEGVCIAKVSDLSLKVAIEKALGDNLVSLKSDFVAFPRGFVDDVRRVVKKSGLVVKEVAAK